MSATPRLTSPYKGLVPYSEEDAALFFGRQAETEIIIANLMASRLTLLYGASGVGKTSVLRAGVVHQVRELGRKNLATRGTAEMGIVYFNEWNYDPVATLQARIAQQMDSLRVATAEFPSDPSTHLTEFLQAWSKQIDGDLMIILDQFEEYFLYHPEEDGPGTLFYEFPHALKRLDLRVSFLVSMREDALSRLDRFKGRISNLFDNYLRIEHLDPDAARAAIKQPLVEYNRQHVNETPITIEPALVDAILNQLKTGAVLIGDGRGVIKRDSEKAEIETPYLQLVMTRLWNEEIGAGSRVLRAGTLTRLGGAERIVRTHLDETMRTLSARERGDAARAFNQLVTPSGTKIAYSVRDLAFYTKTREPELGRVLEKLSSVRILRPVAPPPDQSQTPRYEIFHDVLASAVLDWRARYLQNQRAWRLRFTGIVVALVLLSVLVFSFINLQNTNAALAQQAKQAQDLSVAVLALPVSGTPDPALASVRATAQAVATKSSQFLQATFSSWYEIYFTTPKYPDTDKDHTGSLDEVLTAFINTAKTSIDMAAYQLSFQNVTDALIAAKKRGVVVRVVTDATIFGDAKENSMYKQLQNAGIPVVAGNPNGLMHNKFIVLDNEAVWTGAWNMTVADTYRYDGASMVIHSTELAKNYTVTFGKMFVNKQFGAARKPGGTVPVVNVGGVRVGSYFAPEDNIRDALTSHLSSAQKSILFMAFSFTDDALGSVIMDRAKSGVQVRGVFETTGSETGYSQYPKMKAAGLDVLQDGNPYLMHHKVIVVDEKEVILGSLNFSANAIQSNDENILIVDDETVAKAFIVEFQRVYNQAKNPPKK